MNLTRKYDEAFMFFLVISSLNFFSATFAHFGIFKNISYAFMLGSIVISFPYFFRRKSGFVFAVQIICISILFSVIMAYFSWKQGFTSSLSTIPYLIWFLFFYLLKRNYPIYKIEKVVTIYGFIYIFLFLFQFTHSDVVYFGFKEEFIVDRGITRINFPGAGVFFLAYFMSLNRSSENINYRWLFFLFVVLGVSVTVLQVTRQSIAFVFIITLYHFVKSASMLKKIMVLIFFTVLIIYFFNSNNPISRGLVQTQQETASEGNRYIRIIAGEYFLKEFSPNICSRIFGNGFPNNTSDYGKFTTFLGDTYGFYLSDVGLIAVYAMFGILAVCGYLIIFVKCIQMNLPKKYYYLKYYIWFLLFTCLTSDTLYSINFMITNVFVLYCYQLLYEEQRQGTFSGSKEKNQVFKNRVYNRNTSL